jgi:hypothetical protein
MSVSRGVRESSVGVSACEGGRKQVARFARGWWKGQPPFCKAAKRLTEIELANPSATLQAQEIITCVMRCTRPRLLSHKLFQQGYLTCVIKQVMNHPM